ncbi:MAG: pentapeptide repeat-containing protein [Geobacter sp.]|nr:pentapeptide repeat-containing protein [Geobacter sp.]
MFVKLLQSFRHRRIITALTVILTAVTGGIAPASDICPNALHTGPDYSNQDLHDRNFSNQNLAGANFTGANLRGAVFKGAILRGADFSLAQFGASPSTPFTTSFTQANLENACFAGAIISTAEFEFANVPCAVFDNTDISNARFGPVIKAAAASGPCRSSFQNTVMNCEFIPQWKDLAMNSSQVQGCADLLSGQDFSNSRMNRVVFSGLNLKNTRWTGSQLLGAYFINAELENAVFTGANLKQTQFSQARAKNARFDSQAQLTGAHLSGIDLTGADLTSAVLQGADGLPAADLSMAFMRNAVLTSCEMTGINMSHASFYGTAKADGATLQQVDWTNANLGGANLSQGKMKGARLDAANLVNANLAGADLTPVSGYLASSLVRANLQGADFSGAKLVGANLSSAAVAVDNGVPLFAQKSAQGLVPDLDNKLLTAELATLFSDHGYVLPACENPRIVAIQPGGQWQILLSSPVGPGKYKQFALNKTAMGNKINVTGIKTGRGVETADPVLFTVSGDYSDMLDKQLPPSNLLKDFTSNGYTLPPCSNPYITVSQAGQQWSVKRTATSVDSAGLGYSAFNLIKNSTAINCYGSEILVIQEDSQGQLSLQLFAVQKTKLSADNFDDNTTCPNQRSYKANKDAEATWEEMMTAVNPPKPPPCIPSPYKWCGK